MSEDGLRTHDLVETVKTTEVKQLFSGSLGHWLEQSAKGTLDAEVTPEDEKDFLEDTLPY